MAKAIMFWLDMAVVFLAYALIIGLACLAVNRGRTSYRKDH